MIRSDAGRRFVRVAVYSTAVGVLLIGAAIASLHSRPLRIPGVSRNWDEFNEAWAKAFQTNPGPVCNYPPREVTSSASHAQMMHVARCLSRRRYLSSEAVARLAADNDFAVTNENWFRAPNLRIGKDMFVVGAGVAWDVSPGRFAASSA